ncbi:MAG: glycosyltransferase family 4 protein [Pseudomonadota bacterium]
MSTRQPGPWQKSGVKRFVTEAAKALLITNIPNPYRVPLFNELRRQLETQGIGLLVVFGASGYERRKFRLDMGQCEFAYRVLESDAIHYADAEKVSFTYKGLLGVIASECPDVIVTNGFSIATMKVWARSWLDRTPFLIWSGATHHPAQRVPAWRAIQRRALVRRAAGHIAYGSSAKEYLVSLGAPPSNVEIGINTVDTEYFRSEANRLRAAGARGSVIHNLLCISYLTARKRVDQLLQVAASLRRRRSDFRLTVLGDGPELDTLKTMAVRLGIADCVEFRGFVQKDQIPAYLAATNCFLFPTDYDIWGLVLVEAMAAGAVCIASVNAGAVRDLVKDGETGFAMDLADHEAVAGRVDWILNNPDAAGEIGKNAGLFIRNNVNLARSASGFVRAITKALNAGGPDPASSRPGK